MGKAADALLLPERHSSSLVLAAQMAAAQRSAVASLAAEAVAVRCFEMASLDLGARTWVGEVVVQTPVRSASLGVVAAAEHSEVAPYALDVVAGHSQGFCFDQHEEVEVEVHRVLELVAVLWRVHQQMVAEHRA